MADIAGDYIDKTANGLNEADQTDVTLTVPGAVEGYIDVVFILGGGMTANMETIESAINVFKPAMESGKATVRMGLISLEKGKEIILDLNSDEAVLDPATYVDFVTEKFDSINDLPAGSTNLHSQMLEAQKMLAAETKAKAENKYVFVLATGRTYWFDDANGEQATIVNKVTGTDKKTYYYWANYLWQSQRGRHSSLYMIPDRYNDSYEAFFADIEKWVAADGDKYVFTPHFDANDYAAYDNWYAKNKKDLKALGVSNSRYGLAIVNPVPTADNFITGTVAAIGSGSHPLNALNYERAQYECVQVWKQLVASGYNCYSICSESPSYQNGSEYIKQGAKYTGTSTTQLGHSFMNYLAKLAGQGEAPTVWDFERDEDGNLLSTKTVLQENFFDSVREDMLHTCSTGSTVVDYIGKNENGNFEFIENANYIKLVVGGDEYTTTVATTAKHVDKNGEEAKSSYAFTAPGADGTTFWLDYFYGDGKTTERFVWTFGESVSVERIASLTYKLQLTEKRKEAGRYTVPTNNSATLYPVDSDGNPGDPVLFPVPEVEYIVLPDENYDDPDNFDKSKTATDLYGDRYTDVTLSIPGEVEDLATDIIFVIDKSSSDKLSSGFANELFAQLMAVKRSSGARINVGVVIFNYKAHKQLDLIELNENNYQNLLDSLPTLSGGTNADAGLTMAKKMLDAHDDVDASRKHVIFISDGLSWVFEKDGVQYTVLNKVQSGNSWKNLYGVGTQPYLTLRANESWKIPAQFGTWDAFWSNIKALVENDRAAGDKWLFEMTNHRGEDPAKPKPADLVNTEELMSSEVVNGFDKGEVLFFGDCSIFARSKNAYNGSLKEAGTLCA
ncbi:MAG: VWA domain-containing protein, partial [Clostridia bacterium]|nr:VWA domain-containing protein [Clostridia bacterium]